MTRDSLGWGWSEKQVDGLARRDLFLLLCLLSHVRLLGWYSPESEILRPCSRPHLQVCSPSPPCT